MSHETPRLWLMAPAAEADGVPPLKTGCSRASAERLPPGWVAVEERMKDEEGPRVVVLPVGDSFILACKLAMKVSSSDIFAVVGDVAAAAAWEGGGRGDFGGVVGLADFAGGGDAPLFFSSSAMIFPLLCATTWSLSVRQGG